MRENNNEALGKEDDSNIVQMLDSNQPTEEGSESGETHIPAAINVFDYIIPGHDNDELPTMSSIDHDGNPFTYQDFNDAWTTVVRGDLFPLSLFVPLSRSSSRTMDEFTQQ